jgi:hypothetical protein
MATKEEEIRAVIAYLTYANTRYQLSRVIARAEEIRKEIETRNNLNLIGRN